MQIQISLKGTKEPLVIKGDRIDILDYNMDGIDCKQIRYFRKGFSKSEYINASLITKIKEIKERVR